MGERIQLLKAASRAIVQNRDFICAGIFELFLALVSSPTRYHRFNPAREMYGNNHHVPDSQHKARGGDLVQVAQFLMASVTFAAIVTDIRLESRAGTSARWQIALDHTLFSAISSEGVLTAVAPSGARLEVPVLGVHEDGSTLWHVVGKPLTDGTVVIGTLAELLA